MPKDQFGKDGLFRQDLLGAPELFSQVRVRKRAGKQGATSPVIGPNCYSRCGIYVAPMREWLSGHFRASEKVIFEKFL